MSKTTLTLNLDDSDLNLILDGLARLRDNDGDKLAKDLYKKVSLMVDTLTQYNPSDSVSVSGSMTLSHSTKTLPVR